MTHGQHALRSQAPRARLLACLGAVLASCSVVIACSGGGSPTSPSGNDDPELILQNATIAESSFTIAPGGFATHRSRGLGGFSIFFRPGRLTVSVSYAPAEALVQLLFIRGDGLTDRRDCILFRTGCSILHEVAPGSSSADFVLDPLPALPPPPAELNRSEDSYDLILVNEGTVDAQVTLLVRFFPDLSAPGFPIIEGDWNATAMVAGAMDCGGRAFSGAFTLFITQSGVQLSGGISDAEVGFEGRVEADGTFTIDGTVTPLTGERNEIRGITRDVTFAGQVTGNSMSGSLSQRFADGCESIGTFSANRE